MARKDTRERQRQHAVVNRDIAPYRVRLDIRTGEWVVMREVEWKDYAEIEDYEKYGEDEIE